MLPEQVKFRIRKLSFIESVEFGKIKFKCDTIGDLLLKFFNRNDRNTRATSFE